MVYALGVTLELVGPEIHGAQVAREFAVGLVGEVRGLCKVQGQLSIRNIASLLSHDDTRRGPKPFGYSVL